jgi:hypothetical protein
MTSSAGMPKTAIAGIGREAGHDRRAEQPAHRGDHAADGQRQPHAVDAVEQRGSAIAGTEAARDGGGGAVGEEDEQADSGLDDGTRDAQGG